MGNRAALWVLGVWLLSPVGPLWAVGEKGNILFEYWDGGILSNTIDALVNDPRWPDGPTSEEWRIRFEGITSRADHYATRVRGYLYPPQTGEFTFWIASDDSAELWLSPSENSNGTVKIAYVSGYTVSRTWTTYPSQQSSTRRLEAGKRYYIEVRHVENSGGDNLAVAWTGPGVIGSSATRPVVIEGRYLSPYIRDKDKKASNPSPSNGSDDLRPELSIFQWSPGFGAVSHDLYLGTSPDLLEYLGRQTIPAYLSIEDFATGQRYYWRVDEVEVDGQAIHIGDLWSFSVWPNEASQPDPSDGAKGVLMDATISWRAGVDGKIHHVYLGTDKDAVEEATVASPEHRTITFAATTQYTPPGLEEGTLYYWRVDEADIAGTMMYKGPVWRFKTFAPEPQANLVGHWKFDEARGIQAADYSGLGHTADLIHGVAWAQGYLDGGIDLDGTDDYVSLTVGDMMASLDSITVAAWVNYRNTTSVWQRVFDFGTDATVNMFLTPRIGGAAPNAMRFAITIGSYGSESTVTAGSSLESGWHHVAAMIDGPSRQMGLWLDGGCVTTGFTAVLPMDLGNTPNNWIGRSQYAEDPYLAGRIDDFRLYDRSLTSEELAKVMRGDARLASGPSPSNGGHSDLELTVLTWKAGDGAVLHDLYLGSDPQAVEESEVTDTTGLYRGRQAGTDYLLPPGILAGLTYSWRVDEVQADGSVAVGKVWSFTIGDYLIMDDFEGYSEEDGKKVYQTWVDGYGGNGTGSTAGDLAIPYITTLTVFEGRKALPLGYDNTGHFSDYTGSPVSATYSEISREWTSPQDWTRLGMKALSLQFYGNGANTIEGADTLYVAIRDQSGQTAVVQYPGPAAGLRQAQWHEWNIDLRSFIGVNLAGVKSLVLGIGDRNQPTAQPGGKGRVILDAIRLYPPRCVPAEAKPAGDLNDDCTVDWKDLRIFTSAWLAAGQWIEPKDPGQVTAHWGLDGDAVETLSGAVGQVAGPVAVQGIEGLAMQFTTDADYIDLGPKAGEIVSSLESFSMSIWANPDMIGGAWQRLFDLGNSDQDNVFVSLSRGAPLGTGPRFGIRVAGGTEQAADSTLVLMGGEWNHVAATLDGSARTSTLYINGRVGAQKTNVTFRPRDLGVTSTNYLGKSHYTVDAVYRGLLDDFRIFNRALNPGEILSLAKAPAAYRFDSESGTADLNADGIVDGQDLAILADSWKTWQEWP